MAAKREIFEGRVGLDVGGERVVGRAMFHGPGGTFILAVDERAAQALAVRLAESGRFRPPLRASDQVCLVPAIPIESYFGFLRTLETTTVALVANRPWRLN